MDRTSSFAALSNEAVELYLGSTIPEIEFSAINALTFYREYVSRNRPVVINGVFNHWSAFHKWTDDYLIQTLGDAQHSVALTPDGYADAISDGLFMLPEEKLMKFSDFVEHLNKETEHPASVSSINGINQYTTPVCYIQKQNSNMTTEFQQLLNDVDSSLEWADAAFGEKPDAVNFWMGDHRAVTSLHKDHYENIYCVVRGKKTFTLIPPTDRPFIPYADAPLYSWNREQNNHWLKVKEASGSRVPWISVDPLKPAGSPQAVSEHAHVYTVSVREGQTLYLPSLWFHHVQQSHGCIAVNYWYDMAYDIKYNYFTFVEDLLRHQYKGKPNDGQTSGSVSVKVKEGC